MLSVTATRLVSPTLVAAVWAFASGCQLLSGGDDLTVVGGAGPGGAGGEGVGGTGGAGAGSSQCDLTFRMERALIVDDIDPISSAEQQVVGAVGGVFGGSLAAVNLKGDHNLDGGVMGARLLTALDESGTATATTMPVDYPSGTIGDVVGFARIEEDLFVVGSDGTNSVLVGLDASGAFQWRRAISIDNGQASLTHVAADGAGNLFVAGETSSGGSGLHFEDPLRTGQPISDFAFTPAARFVLQVNPQRAGAANLTLAINRVVPANNQTKTEIVGLDVRSGRVLVYGRYTDDVRVASFPNGVEAPVGILAWEGGTDAFVASFGAGLEPWVTTVVSGEDDAATAAHVRAESGETFAAFEVGPNAAAVTYVENVPGNPSVVAPTPGLALAVMGPTGNVMTAAAIPTAARVNDIIDDPCSDATGALLLLGTHTGEPVPMLGLALSASPNRSAFVSRWRFGDPAPLNAAQLEGSFPLELGNRQFLIPQPLTVVQEWASTPGDIDMMVVPLSDGAE